MNALIDTANYSASVSLKDAHSAIQHASAPDLEELSFPNHYQPTLLQGVLESMMDGVLVLTCYGNLIYANQCARQVCDQILQDSPQPNLVPQEIWHVCEALIESRALFPDRSLIIEDEIQIAEVHTIRIRARWLESEQAGSFCLLVTLEDRYQSVQNIAIAEAYKYGLTERETEVWLLRRANLTYKAIAAQLHITVDTVKKHVKNINVKRQSILWE